MKNMFTHLITFSGCPKNKCISPQTIQGSEPKNQAKQSEGIFIKKSNVFYLKINQIFHYLSPEISVLIVFTPRKTCKNLKQGKLFCRTHNMLSVCFRCVLLLMSHPQDTMKLHHMICKSRVFPLRFQRKDFFR